MANEKEINKIITYTHRKTLAPLLVQVVSIFEKLRNKNMKYIPKQQHKNSLAMKEKHRYTMYTYIIQFLMCYLLGFVSKT